MIRKSIKVILESIILPVLYYSRIYDLCLKFAKRDFVIVMYHGINTTEKDFNFNSRHIKLNLFEKHLKFFQKHFDVITLDQLYRLINNQKRRIKKKKLIITFDDGYKNNLYACALAQEYKIPITLFITTGSLNDNTFMNYADRLDFIIFKTNQTEFRFNSELFKLKDYNSKIKLKYYLLSYLKKQNSINKNETFKELESKLNPDYSKLEDMKEFFELLKNEDIRRIKKNRYVEVASHTVTHDNLENLTAQEIRYELSKSKAKLEQLTGREVKFLSYPDGSYNQKTIELTRQYYQLACAVTPRMNRKGENFFEMRRLGFSTQENFYHQIFLLILEFFRKR